MRTTFSFGLALFFVSLPSFATTYQVGPSRTYKTLGAVASMLNPGDVVEVDGNATYAGGIVLGRAGAAGNPITVRGIRVNGQRPVLSGGTNTIEIQGDHYVLEGFDVTAASFRCVFHHSDDVVMRDLVVHDCARHGILGADQDSGSLTLEYSEVYGCGGGTGDHQIYMATDEVAHPGAVFRMQHCYVHDANGGNSVKSRAERNEIYYNWIEGAAYHELELIGPDPNGAQSAWTEGLKREDSDVVGNVLRKTQTTYVVRFGGDATGQSNGRYRFVANTVLTRPGGSAVFRLFDGLESVEMHDNVFFVDPSPTGASNILREVEAAWTTGSRIVSGSNNWVLSQATNVPAEWTDTIKGSDPMFVSMSAMNLRPVSGGPLASACTCMSSPAGHDFPSPLAWPAFEPPLHALEAPGTAQARSVSGQLDIGAFQSSSGTGGAPNTGGAPSTGGTASTGGAPSTGGAVNTGGVVNTGGAANTGGAPDTGGAANTGGAVNTGGATSTGGAGGASGGGSSTGGAVGSPGSGGATTTGGTAAQGGSATGGRGQAGVQSTGGAEPSPAEAVPMEEGGCTCRVGTAVPRRGLSASPLAALALLALRKRKRRT